MADKIVSPKGELAWVTITGEGKENMSGKMQYLASVILDPKNDEEHKAFIDSIDEFWANNRPEGKKKAKSLGYYLNDPLLDKDGQKQYDEDDKLIMDPDGKVIVAFKTSTTFPDGKPKVVRIRNAKNNQVSLGDKQIGNGSFGRISGAIDIYVNKQKDKVIDAGVTLYLDAIQLLKFVEYTGGETGFEEEEGWTGDENMDEFEEQAAEPESHEGKVKL